MRRIAIAGGLLLLLWSASAPAVAQLAAEAQSLAGFAERIGLRDAAGLVEAVQSLRAGKRLPPRYVTKEAARDHGWRGGGLCDTWPGHVIGGDVFHNFGSKLPGAPGRVYREADLDATCRSRGAKRLIFSDDGRIYVTVDHYNSFVPVP
jgi:guanyl-specific ribonuclease Sa